jgi:2-phosphosulfolactate phosphatase
MQIQRASLANCSSATGMVVVIDVIRAFTTAAFLFNAGVQEILLVSGVDEALALRRAMPAALVAGELGGIPVPGFDLGNSPAQAAALRLVGRTVIQRTSAGTQGVVLSRSADTLLAAALTNLSATVRYIQAHPPEYLTLVQTGQVDKENWGDEDVACADLIERQLRGEPLDLDATLRRVRDSYSGQHFDGSRPEFPPADLDLVLQVDRFQFAMCVERSGGLHHLRPVAL